MTRRVALSFVGLAVLLLAGVVLPLGLLTADQDRLQFRDAAVAATQNLAAVAEEALTDRSDAVARELSRAVPRGDRAVVLDAQGRAVFGGGVIAPPSLLARAQAGHLALVWRDDQLLVAAPAGDGDRVVGLTVLARSTSPLDERLAERWTLLAAVSVLAILAAIGLSLWLARWSARPLSALQRTATAYGDGDLAARADTRTGPPEVRALAEEFNRTAARLEQLVHGHRVLVADVAHQVRTPLAALRLRLELLAQEAEGEAAEELAWALEEVGRLSRLVDGLLTAARAEAGAGPRVAVDVMEVLEGRAEAWRPLAEERGASVDVAADGHRPLVRVGEGHLEQVLDNLIANALDVGAEHVVLRAQREGEQVELAVVDDGPGMSAEQRAGALRRFEARRPGGTGLGLSIVDRLVTADGGGVRLLQSPGHGLTVVVHLPSA